MKNLFSDIKALKNFIVLWVGQSVSGLGSAMTSFAIILWAYEKMGSALTVSLLSVFYWLPKILADILFGGFVDRFSKKKTMLYSDLSAGACTGVILVLLLTNRLEIWHIYFLNMISGALGSLQAAASDVTTTLIVSKEHYVKISGMRSFSEGTIGIFAPMFAAVLFSVAGMNGVIAVDLITLVFACFTLLFFVRIPKATESGLKVFRFKEYIEDMKTGFRYMKDNKNLATIVMFFAFINFVAGLAYYSILSPMILAKTNHNAGTLALVNGALGIGSIVGGILVSVMKPTKNKIKAMFLSAALSFFMGDILFGLGRNQYVWICAAFCASFFIPFITGNATYIWRTSVSVALQGRVFSFRNALQTGMLPLGLFFGGFLADTVFEPLMIGSNNMFTALVGNTMGSGMSLMFLFTGTMGTVISVLGYRNKQLRNWEQ